MGQFSRVPTARPKPAPKYAPGFIPLQPETSLELEPTQVLNKGEATRFVRTGARVRAEVDAATKKLTQLPASVDLPPRSEGYVRVKADSSTIGIDFALKNARPGVELEVSDGLALYPGAAPDGGDVVMRVTRNSVEDFVVLYQKPQQTFIDYTVNVSEVAGLRLYGNSLEFLAKNGDPQVRIDPPSVSDSDGVTRWATLSLLGCQADTSDQPPWDRPVTPAGADECTVRVSWDDSKLIYPLIVDPVWASAADMPVARYQFPAVRLATSGRTLVCGGLDANGDALTSCHQFNPAGGANGEGSWASSTAMGTARYNFNFVWLSGNNVLAVGGEGTDTSERYNGTTWTASTGDFNGICPTCGGTVLPAITSDGNYVVMMSYQGQPYVWIAGTNTWVIGTPNPLANPTYRYGAAVIGIPGQNTILRVGGYWYPSSVAYLKTAERYKPSFDPQVVASPVCAPVCGSGEFCIAAGNCKNPWASPGDAASMVANRAYPGVLPLDTNRIMVYGGNNAIGNVSSAEIYSGSGNAWTATTGDLPSGSANQNGHGNVYALHTSSGKFLLAPNGGPYIYDPQAAASPFYRMETYPYSFYTFGDQGNVTTAGTKVLMVPVQPQGNNSPAQKACRLFDFGDKGSFCTSTGECKSGLTCVYDQYNYVDGKSVCCDTACTEFCQSCRAQLKTSQADEGTCGPRSPDYYIGSDYCPYTEQSTCGTTGGYCDGAGNCAKWDTNTYCGYQTCAVDNISQNNARFCDGNGNCDAVTTTACDPGYLCSGNSCLDYCYNDNGYCAPGYFCNTVTSWPGTCDAKKSDGAACNYNNAECLNDHCVDGVCCDTACDATCEACTNALTGQATGSCKPVLTTALTYECGDYGTGSCGQNGKCDGAGACQLYSAGTVCQTAYCASATSRYNNDTCNGTGTCNDGGTTNCATGYSCVNGTCQTSCTTDSQCASAYYCDTALSQCVPDKTQGQACTRDAVCSGNANCVDSVCCDSSCSGSCRSCLKNRTGLAADGVCGNIVDDTDPENECAIGAAYPNSCAAPGLCNGIGACRPYAKLDVECDPDVCSDSTLTTYECNGAGTCKAKAVPCYPFKCNAANNGCRVDCSDDAHCVTGSSCENGTCVGQLEIGQGCTRGAQCKSTYCANVGQGVLDGQDPILDPITNEPIVLDDGYTGVCCDEDCRGLCRACKKSIKGGGSDGVCDPVADYSDPKDDCPLDTVNPCGNSGLCDGGGGCRRTPNGTSCGTSSCKGNTVVGQTCDDGVCLDDSGFDCEPYVCRDVEGAFQCTNPCASDNDCRDGYYCNEKQCSKKLANGKVCETSGICDSGYCVDGVCCDASCNGQCEACDAPGSEGVCIAVQGTPHGTRTQCDHAGEECGGECDGVNAAACKYKANGETCGEASCTNAVAESSACDGQGTCRAAKSQQCSPFNCGDDDTCLTLCDTDDECTQGYACDETTQRCLPATVAAECSADADASVGQNGLSTPCRPYLCVRSTGTCAVSCAATTDCAAEFVCEASTKTCLPAPPDAGTGDEEGCACRAAGASTSRSNYPLALVALGLALTGLRRRKRSPQTPTRASKPARFESGSHPSE